MDRYVLLLHIYSSQLLVLYYHTYEALYHDDEVPAHIHTRKLLIMSKNVRYIKQEY